MSFYKGMDAHKLEAEYNLAARRGIESYAGVAERWRAGSAAYRDNASVKIDLAYGDGERDKLDFFSCGNAASPLLVYLHGGYWQRGDKSIYSFLAEAFVKQGVSVAIPNYNLAPSVRIGQIAPQIRNAIAWLFHHSGDLGFSREKLTVMGHSAGGHLTAMIMATNWPVFDSGIPLDLVRCGIPISGVFELEPLVHTSLNEGLQMDIEEAVAESPMFIAPVTNASQLVVAGGGETSEFLRQSDDYAAKYANTERSIVRYNVPDADHFDELERLAEEDSPFFKKSLNLIAG